MATATATAAVTTVVVTRNMRWCLRQKIKGITETYLNAVDDSSIDYTLPLAASIRKQCSGALFSHADFITRSDVVLVSGIHRGEPEIVGRYDSLGNPLEA